MNYDQNVTVGFYGYRREEIEPLTQTLRDHGIEADTEPIPAGGGGPLEEVPVILSIGAGIGLGKLCELFFEQAYDAWLRSPLSETLFKQDKTVKRKPRLELQGTDLAANIEPQELADIDAAVKTLPQAVSALERSEVWRRAEKPMVLSMTYKNGTWRANGRRSSYAYRPDTGEYEEAAK